MKTAVKLILYYLLYQLFCGLALQKGCPILAQVLDISLAQLAPYLTGVTMILAGSLMITHLFLYHYVSFKRSDISIQGIRSIGITLPFILCSLVVVNLMSEWIPLPDWMEDTFTTMSHNGFGLVSIAILAPLVEELLFRDAIQGHFIQQEMKPRAAIFLSALLFGLIHLNPAQIPFAFCIGLVLGWVYYRTGNLLPCITGHLINNAISATCMATLSPEVLNTPITHYLGFLPTLLLLVTAIVGGYASYLYINKHYPTNKK